MNETAAIILAQFPTPVRELAEHIRVLLHEQLPEILEQPDFPARMIAYGYGSGYKDTICTLILSQKEVKVGFYKGAELPDPKGLLTGTGKVHRYVAIPSRRHLNADFLKLLHQAFIAYQKRVQPPV